MTAGQSRWWLLAASSMTGVEPEIPKCRPDAKEFALKNGRLIKVEEKRGGRPRKDLGKNLDRVEHLASLGVARRTYACARRWNR